jgi:two-component system response regulator MprA
MPTASVLVVDDEPGVRASLVRALGLEGFEATDAESGDVALSRIEASNFDVVVLDVSMPEVSGIDVCQTLRRSGDRVPVLMLTARDEIDDRVAGLEAGADDYLVKPFALKELVARIRALLRRMDPGAEPAVEFDDLRLNRETRQVHRGEREIQLSRTEFSLLELFMRDAGIVLSRTEIYEKVWGYDFGPRSNALGVYIGYLRRKLEAAGEPRLIHTVRGFGYVLRRP